MPKRRLPNCRRGLITEGVYLPEGALCRNALHHDNRKERGGCDKREGVLDQRPLTKVTAINSWQADNAHLPSKPQPLYSSLILILSIEINN